MMKRILCLMIAMLLVISATAINVLQTDAAENGKLVITDEGRVLAEVSVGSGFLFRVGLYSGPCTLVNGKGVIRFDSAKVKPVLYGDPSANHYSFCEKVLNTSLVVNYTDDPDNIYYNFSAASGIEGFTDPDQPYIKIRFKAVAAGEVEIHHTMETLTAKDEDNNLIKLFNKSKPNEQLDDIPYTIGSAEPAAALVGDANGDNEVTILDATCVQMITAGKKLTYLKDNADANADGDVNLKDALVIQRYKAGIATGTQTGNWLFGSEQ